MIKMAMDTGRTTTIVPSGTTVSTTMVSPIPPAASASEAQKQKYTQNLALADAISFLTEKREAEKEQKKVGGGYKEAKEVTGQTTSRKQRKNKSIVNKKGKMKKREIKSSKKTTTRKPIKKVTNKNKGKSKKKK